MTPRQQAQNEWLDRINAHVERMRLLSNRLIAWAEVRVDRLEANKGRFYVRLGALVSWVVPCMLVVALLVVHMTVIKQAVRYHNVSRITWKTLCWLRRPIMVGLIAALAHYVVNLPMVVN